jgi:repressor LexA
MSDTNLSLKAREALRHIRNFVMRNGRVPSTRELMKEMNYKSPLSPMLLLNELAAGGFVEKKPDGGYTLVKDLTDGESARTVAVPLVGIVACGLPILAQQNIEALIPVSTKLAKPGSIYFLLRAQGNSMDAAGISDGDLILIKQQAIANNGQHVVALIDDEATIKEFQHKNGFVTLMPRSTNPIHQPIILTQDFQIQGIVVATIPKSTIT